MTASPQSPAPTRTFRRAVVEHVDVRNRDFHLDYLLGREPSHRHCAGGPSCSRRATPLVLSLPGGTLTLAVAIAAAALLGRTAS